MHLYGWERDRGRQVTIALWTSTPPTGLVHRQLSAQPFEERSGKTRLGRATSFALQFGFGLTLLSSPLSSPPPSPPNNVFRAIPSCSPALGPYFCQLALSMSLPSLPHALSCLFQLNGSPLPAAPPHQVPVLHPSHTQALCPTNPTLYNSKAILFPCSLMFTPSVINVFSLSPIVPSIIKHWKAERWIWESSSGLPATGKEGLEKASAGAQEWQSPPCSAPALQPQP